SLDARGLQCPSTAGPDPSDGSARVESPTCQSERLPAIREFPAKASSGGTCDFLDTRPEPCGSIHCGSILPSSDCQSTAASRAAGNKFLQAYYHLRSSKCHRFGYS